MITNFERQTEKVTDAEKALIPYIVDIVSRSTGKEKAITNDKIRKKIEFQAGKGAIKDFRLRVLIHHIRCRGYIERLCSSSKGYYIGTKDECETYIKSLEERIESIKHLHQALKKQTQDPKRQLSIAI